MNDRTTTRDTLMALTAVAGEVESARAKFPANKHLLAALVEEVGELANALLETGNSAAAKGEAMQVACVAVRLMTEGDSTFDGDVTVSPQLRDQKPREFTADEQRRLREIAGEMKGKAADSLRSPAAKPKMKRAYVRKDKLGDPTGAAVPEKKPTVDPKAVPSTCPDCGLAYVKTSNVQKRCPACAVLKQKAQSAAWSAEKRADKNPAATPDRLAAIKAADKRLDTIPE